MSRPLGVIVCSLFVLALAPLAPGQQTGRRAQFEATVDVMRIQIAVADAKGVFVPGLRAQDFTLRIEGEPRQIVDLLEISDRKRATEPAGPSAEDSATPARLGVTVGVGSKMPSAAMRHFMIFIDLTQATRRSIRYTREAALGFLESNVLPSDMVGLAIYSPRGGLDMRVPFTTDHARTVAMLEQVGTSRAMERPNAAGEGIDLEAIAEFERDGGGAGKAEFIDEIEQIRLAMVAQDMIDGLHQLTEALAVVQGRKHVLFFSHGLPDEVLVDAGFRADANKVISGSRLSDMVIDTFQPGILPVSSVNDVRRQTSGLRIPGMELNPNEGRAGTRGIGSAMAGIDSLMAGRAVLSVLAKETGGSSTFYRHALRKGLDKVDEASRSYYVLAFPVRSDDPEQVDIEVGVRRAGTSVVWAPTRLTLPGALEKLTSAQRSLEVAEALDLVADRADMQFDLLTMPLSSRDGVGRMALVVEIPPREIARLLEKSHNAALEFEVLGLAVDSSRTVRDYFQTRARPGGSTQHQSPEGISFRYYNLVVVPPGRYYVKILLRESVTGEIASRSMRFEVPEAPDPRLRMAGPVLVTTDGKMIRGVDPEAPPPHREGRPLTYPYVVSDTELTPELANVLASGGEADLFVTVYNLALHPFSRATHVSVQGNLRRPQGASVAIEKIVVVASDQVTGDELRLVVRLRLPRSLPSGAWQLVLHVTDGVSGQTTQGILPVTVLVPRSSIRS